MIKHPDKNNLRIVYFSPWFRVVYPGGEIKAAETWSNWSHCIHTQMKRVMNVYLLLGALHPLTAQDASQGIATLTVGSLPISTNTTHIMPHKHDHLTGDSSSFRLTTLATTICVSWSLVEEMNERSLIWLTQLKCQYTSRTLFPSGDFCKTSNI